MSGELPPVSEPAKQPFKVGVKITGGISGFGCPELTVSFAGIEQKFKAIIDTGAFYNYVSPKILQKLDFLEGAGMRVAQHPLDGLIKTPCFRQKFSIEGVSHNFEDFFNMMTEAYQYDVIIGSDFLSRCKSFLYLGGENKFEIEF